MQTMSSKIGGTKRRFKDCMDDNNYPSKRMRYNNNNSYIPINEREQMTRKQIAHKLHFESWNDENQKVFTLKNQLSLLKNDNCEDGLNIDNKIVSLIQTKKYEKNRSGLHNMLNDLEELEKEYNNNNNNNNDNDNNKKHQNIVNNYCGNLLQIEITQNIKNLTINTRDRAFSKLFQIIQQNYVSHNDIAYNEKYLIKLTQKCELKICISSINSIKYAQLIRNQLKNIRDLTKLNKLFKIQNDLNDDNDSSDYESSDHDEDSDIDNESSDDDDIPIGVRLRQKQIK